MFRQSLIPPAFELYFKVSADSPLSLTAADLLLSGKLTPSQSTALSLACSTGNFDQRSLYALRDGLVLKNPNSDEVKNQRILDLIKKSSAKAHFSREVNADLDKKDNKSRIDMEEAKAKRRLELTDRQAHREYAELTSSVRRVEEKNSQAAGFKLYSQQISLGMSLLVTLISAVLLGFFAGRQMFGVERPGAALTVAAIAGTSLFIVEAILMITRLSRVDAKTHRKERTTAMTQG